MDVSKLSEGLIVKNYKELCEVLGIEKRSGKSKQLQLIKLKNHIDFIQKGHSFIVKEVYNSTDAIKREILNSKRSIYTSLIEILILDILSSTQDNKLLISKSRLFSKLGLVNRNYIEGYVNQDSLSMKLNVNSLTVNDFYTLNNANLNSSIDSALASLEKKSLLIKKDVTLLKLRDNRLHIEADDHMESVILGIERELKKLHNFKMDSNIKFFINNPRFIGLIESRDKLMSERCPNVEFYYNSMKLIINHKHLEEEKLQLKGFILDELERLEKMKLLNDSYAKNVMYNAEKRFLDESEVKNNRKDINYVTDFKKLTDKLININDVYIDYDYLKGLKVLDNASELTKDIKLAEIECDCIIDEDLVQYVESKLPF